MGEPLASLCAHLLRAAQRSASAGVWEKELSMLCAPGTLLLPPAQQPVHRHPGCCLHCSNSCGEQLSLFTSEVRSEQAHLASGVKQYSPFSLLVKKTGKLAFYLI